MILTADYHTHTVFSHGKGTIEENALAAKAAGLKEIGISDHGFAHPAFGLTASDLPEMRKDCDLATEKTGVKTLLGIESNFVGADGATDLKTKYYDYFDIYLAGVHKFVMYKIGTLFSMAIPNFFLSKSKRPKPSERLIKENTAAYINVIKKNPVDVITHLNYCCFVNAAEVAKAAADYGTYIELNAKKVHLTDEELYAVEKTGVNFVIGSDAHTPDRVGEISLVKKMLERVNIPEERIMNINGKTPDFRFKKFKENAGR